MLGGANYIRKADGNKRTTWGCRLTISIMQSKANMATERERTVKEDDEHIRRCSFCYFCWSIQSTGGSLSSAKSSTIAPVFPVQMYAWQNTTRRPIDYFIMCAFCLHRHRKPIKVGLTNEKTVKQLSANRPNRSRNRRVELLDKDEEK